MADDTSDQYEPTEPIVRYDPEFQGNGMDPGR